MSHSRGYRMTRGLLDRFPCTPNEPCTLHLCLEMTRVGMCRLPGADNAPNTTTRRSRRARERDKK